MHQAVLARAERNREVLARRKLRLIRSSSASLPPQVMRDLEATFGCPVIESYGMTEACHQMSSNPLPPAARKPGTVGRAAGPQVAIMGGDGALLASGEAGEIVIRGENVTAGYANNPKANADAFRNGWFRTGDLGRLDGEGYLTIEGRLKEIINRGGEKISPHEVEDALLSHPDVVEAVAFALPDAKYGESVGAAVVMRSALSEDALRAHCGDRLAAFKVPVRVHVVDAIPKGPTGKVQRRLLAEQLP
jgi:acyl-CoA synthetase (AMP-forming)/AMP-acid ligase II